MAENGLTTTSGSERGRYFSRAWAQLTHDKGWVKPALVMTVADLVPVAGPLGTLGYKLEWARLLAWGADVSPKQKDVQVGACISSGWRAFLVFLGWCVVMGLIGSVCGAVPLLGGLLGTLWSAFSIYLYTVTRVAALRATIYQKAGAGYKVRNIWDMCSRDVNGLLSIIGWQLLFYVAIAVVCGLAMVVCALGALPKMIYFVEEISYYSYGYTSSYAVQTVFEFLAYLIAAFGPTLLVLGILGAFAHTLLSMVVYAALGLWMRQFDLPNWGRSEDPLPSTVPGGAADAEQDAPAPVMPVAPAAAAPEQYNQASVPEDQQPVQAVQPVQTEQPVQPVQPAAPVVNGGQAPVPQPAAPVQSAQPTVPAAEPEYAPDGSEVISVEPVAQAVPDAVQDEDPQVTEVQTPDSDE